MDQYNSKQEELQLSEDTKVLKEETNRFSSKLVGNEMVTLASETSYNSDLIITTTKSFVSLLNTRDSIKKI